MNKVNGAFMGFLTLSLMFLMAATFACISLLGMCVKYGLLSNLIIASIAEIILFVWGVTFIKNSSNDIYNETHDKKLVREFYTKIAFLMGFGIAFSLIMIAFPYGMFSPNRTLSDPILIYAFNIAIPALIVLVWMWIRIHKINLVMRY